MDLQAYAMTILPMVAVVIGVLYNGNQINVVSATLNERMSTVENRLLQVESLIHEQTRAAGARFDRFEDKLDVRFASLEAKFDLLTGKVIELDTRLTRLEERLKS